MPGRKALALALSEPELLPEPGLLPLGAPVVDTEKVAVMLREPLLLPD